MCSPFDLLSCPDAIRRGIEFAKDTVTGAADAVAKSAFDAMFESIAAGLGAGIKSMAILLAGWILVPSTQVCDDTAADWVAQCATGASPAAQLQGWMLPLTILVAIGGLLWQGITMALTRRGEPLVQAVRGMWTTALWGAVGIAGTQLALRAGDGYSYWILKQSIFGDSANPVDTMGTRIAEMAVPEAGMALVALILLEVPILFITLAQVVLMVFREGAVVILAGLLQLAAAGSFTRATAGWLPKVAGWMLALVVYKPAAATVYATAFLLMGEGGRNFVMGLAMLVLSLIAMPALMKFFTWTVGTAGSSGGGLAMLGGAAAAGVHAASSLRGASAAGGYSAAEHTRYMDTNGPTGSANPSTATPPAGSGGPPTGAAASTAASASAAGTAGSSAAGSPAAAAGAAATGAGAPVAAVVIAGQTAASTAKRAAGNAADATQGTDR